ncbi:GIP [Symbiodinium sp. CCMP2592]|nr:GIP [Symbiodinium sp. CCMP2592]
MVVADVCSRAQADTAMIGRSTAMIGRNTAMIGRSIAITGIACIVKKHADMRREPFDSHVVPKTNPFELLKEIGHCTLKEYLMEIGHCTLKEYLKEIGHCTLKEYLMEIGHCTLKEYLMEIGLCTRKEYLKEIGHCTRKEYLMEIGRCTLRTYLMEIGRCTLRTYLMEIGRCTLRTYLMEIGRCTLRMYLMEIGRCTLRTYLKVIKLRMRWVHKIKSAAATPDATSTTKTTPGAKARPDKKEKLCKWFAKSDDGCRRGAECQFQHDWGTTAKTGRCLLCSALGHQKKDCPTKKQGEPAQQSPTSGPKEKGKGDKGGGAAASSSTAVASPATRSLATGGGQKEPPQPGPEPSPAGSPASSTKEPSGDLQQILTDAHQMLKTMMATTTPAATTTSGAPTYESIQRQLDEMKLKALKVSTPQTTEDERRGALLDSGATHVLRPARDEREHLTSKEVPVVLAGDEKRGLMLKHPKYGTIRTRIRAGCPEIADPVQAARLISELESRRMDELRQRTLELQDRLNAIRMMEAKTEDWRQDLAAYASEGCVVDGLQVLYKSPIFKGLPEEVLMGMVPNVEANDKPGWEYLKGLPVSRRIRKKLMRSKVNVDTNSEVVAINVEILLHGGWSMRGPAYKALMWGPMTSRVKAVIGSPPAKTYDPRPCVKEKDAKPWRTKEDPYGITGLSPTEMYYVNKETSLTARQILLYLVAHTCSKGRPVGWMMSNPGDPTGVSEAKDGIDMWQTPMMKEFLEVVKPLGATTTTMGPTGEEDRKGAAITICDNINLKEFLQDGGDQPGPSAMSWSSATARVRRSLMTALQMAGIASTAVWQPQEELRKLTAEQGWKLHVKRDHVPFKKDCEYCVMMMGSGKQHRRTKQKCLRLSVDVGGPMRIKAETPKEAGDMASSEYDFSDLSVEEGSDEPLDEEAQRALLESELADIELSEPEVSEDLAPQIQAMKAADKLWDDDELVAEDQEKMAADDEPLEGNHEIPIDHLYFIKPLKTKTGKEDMRAIQEVVLQLRQENLPVLRIHSDRAHELRSPALRAWTLDNNIWLTRTEGQAPQSNGTAERAVRFLKGRARTLLRAAGMGTEHWATAMDAAAHRQREERLRPEDPLVPCPYGTRVAIKKKRYGDRGRHDLLPHWTKGVYMGPVWDVNGGSAILEDETNRFTVTTHLRACLHDPGALKDEDEIDVLPLRPVRRLLKKGPIGEDGLAIKKIEKENYARERAALVKEILDLMEKDPVHKVKRPQLTVEDGDREDTSYSTVGAFNFGGKFGITKYTKEAPQLTEKVTQLLKMDFPMEVFTSATIVRNAVMPTHRGAGVWEKLQPGDMFRGKYHAMDVNGTEVPGQIHLTEPVKVNPRRWHSPVQGTEGLRILVAGHTINSWRKLTAEMREELLECGFAVPDEEDFEARLKAIREEAEQTRYMEFEVHEGDCLGDLSNRDSPVEVDEDITRCSKAAVENLYTRGIEKILAELEGQADADVWQIKGPDGWVTDEAYEWMAATWEVTPCQYAESSASVRFLGMEIRQETNEEGEITNYTLDQEGYIEELLRQHAVSPTEKSLLPSAKEWLTMARPVLHGERDGKLDDERPRESCDHRPQDCKTLAYLNATKQWKLSFFAGGSPDLVTYTDSSYSPDGGKSHGGAVVFWAGSPVAWKSGRQSLVTTSSAETELLAASEGATLTYSIDAMLSDVGIVPLSREVRVDNSAAITLASEEGGSWRTRHLKVRAAALRQRIQEGWARIAYCPGEWQLADGLTKILPSKRMEMLMRRWGLGRKEDLPRGEDARECVRSSWELYVLVTMLVICAVAIWEGCKGVIKGRSEVVRLRSLEASRDRQRLSKVELRTLSALLQRDPETLSREERVDLIHLADLCGSDVSEAVGMSVTSSRTRRKSSPTSDPTCSAGIRPEEEKPRAVSPPPQLFPERPTRKGTKITPAAPMSSWDDPAWNERPSLVKRFGRTPRTSEAATQCELLGDIPKKVFMTPRGTCVHASRSCSTGKSTRFQERDVCQKCVRGQREETEYRGTGWLR